jgi:hypothetical protein
MITLETSAPNESPAIPDLQIEIPTPPQDRSASRPTAHRRRTRPFPRRQTTALSRHARKCTVCRHKDRADIDADFLHWHSAENIAAENNLDRAAIYRHAHSTGLVNERMRNIRYAAIHIAEQAESVTPTAGQVLQAIRACTLIDDEGKWNDPPKRVIIEYHHITTAQAEAITTSTASTTESAPKSADSNRNFSQSETPATPTKQTEPPSSNRNFRSTKIDASQQHPTSTQSPSSNADRGAP